MDTNKTYLLDTHILIWFLHNDVKLSKQALEIIETADVVVSIATIWEIAIKTSLGKLTLAEPFADFFPKQLQINDIKVLHASIEHLKQVNQLEFIHRDPFDRLIISQAMVEDMILISKDTVFADYDVQLLW